MAVCNLFKPLNPGGNFLMFSQYAEDLTKMTSKSNYRVSPSKFMALNLNYAQYDNKTFPDTLQNKFENGCAYLRNNPYLINNPDLINGGEWNPTISSNLFWACLCSEGLINQIKIESSKTEPIYIIDGGCYYGDINLQSHDTHEGMGYSEIYCYIPNESRKQNIVCSIPEQSTIVKYDKGVLEGYDIKCGHMEYLPDFNFKIGEVSDDTEAESFEFNTIIVFYDIYEDNEPVATSIPLGMYLTGEIVGGKVSNPVTKYISNGDIYGAGTSYGLRICSRFTVTPNQDGIKTGDIKTVNITTDSGDYASLSYVLSEMSKTINKMNDVVDNIHQNNQFIKTSLAAFKNSRTNVPYVKKVGDAYYWFVNGRNTYIALNSFPYDPKVIDDIIDKYDETL